MTILLPQLTSSFWPTSSQASMADRSSTSSPPQPPQQQQQQQQLQASSSSSSSISQGDRELIADLVSAHLEHIARRQQQPSNGKVLVAAQAAASSASYREGKSRGPMVAELAAALTSLTDDYERRYGPQLLELRANWTIDCDSPRASFRQVLDSLLMDDCNWGRFITIFVFVSLFLRQCQEQQAAAAAGGRPVCVTPADVHCWTVDYIATRVLPWVKRNGDWMGLIRFYKDGDPLARLPPRGEDNGVLRRVLTVAGAGLALMSLTSFLVKQA